MPKLRISVVEYLNTAPLVWGFLHGPVRGRYDLRMAVPAQCADDLRAGAVDVGIIPVIEYQRIPGVVMLPDMAVAAKNIVRSILVVARRPIEHARRFALDASSRSSAALVRILCAEHWRIQPEFVEAKPDAGAMLADADAALIIGDPALRISVALEAPSGIPAAPGVEALYVYDVAQQWRALTGLPCVLAAWVARPGVATSQVIADFLASKEYGLARLAEIARDAAQKLRLPAAACHSYLRDNIDFSLDEENRRGLELYFAKAAALGLIPRPRGIEILATANVVGT